ncbi:ketopantoate reductase family protein [Anaerotardibacter muris]|uniref:ketopantoate reductase family protein n=1 Tax=Anaerotardibacter muris TaxID=2941505 RepID=UPI00203C6419|nr:ketopantoate reductase family protein [Anaerotardibacter muris]
MNIAVLGAGSLGSAIGGTLALAGNDVTLIGRAAHVEAIDRSGLTLVTPHGEERADVRAQTTAEGLEPADLVLVMCKSFDTRECIETNRSVIGPETIVLSLQNGLGNEDLLCELLDPNQVIAGKTYIGGMMLEPGKVQSTTEGKQTFIGEYSGPITPRIENVAQLFNDAGMECIASKHMKNIIWDKLLINVATGAVCGVTKLPYGDFYQHPELVDTALAAVSEGMRVAIAEGIMLTRHDPREVLELARENLPYDFKPSILQSLEKHRRTEIDVINGAVVTYGKRHQIETPVNETLVACVKGIERYTEIYDPAL